MATCLGRSWTQLRLLRQSFASALKYEHAREHDLQIRVAATLGQHRLYRVSAVCFKNPKHRKREPQVSVVIPSAKKQAPVVSIWPSMTVKELAQETKRSTNAVLEAVSRADLSSVYRVGSQLNVEVARAASQFLGFKCMLTTISKDATEQEEGMEIARRPPPDPSVLVKRHPIVTIMGHVDHGKTTLLDSLRKTSVVDSEFGGITQHIGAFNVTLETGEKVTFLDTPGHAAFSAMRARGAQATDIVVLVVAADDGVMEQTLESIKMARSANVPMLVAINKIDKPSADIKRTQRMLSEHGIVVDELGGNVQSVNISALKGTNLEDLVAAITLEAEMRDLKGDPTGLVEGVIIECSNDPGRGKLATVLVQRGTLKKGAFLVSGMAWAKVRSMFDHRGCVIQSAGLSDAVQIIGWRSLPDVGDELLEVPTEKRARDVVQYRESKRAEKLAHEHKAASDIRHQEYQLQYKEHLEKKRLAGEARKRMCVEIEKNQPESNRVNVIVKGDVVGSVEAILDVLETYKEHKDCALNLIHYGVGSVNETDLQLAETFDAIIYAFNVSTPKKFDSEIEQKNLSVRHYNVIYKMIDDLKAELDNKMPPVPYEETLGHAEVLQQFSFKEGKTKVYIAGCRCDKGVVKKDEMCRVLRNNEVIYDGKIASLKHEKSDVNTIKSVKEFGIRLEDSSISFEHGDEIVCYTIASRPGKTSWNPF